MQFKSVNKPLYRQRYKTVSCLLVATLIVLAPSLSSLLVAIWGESNSGNNFWLNLGGVSLAAVLVAGLLLHFKGHAYLTELSYVWDLKQTLNKINRKLRIVRKAAEQGDATALLILSYYYEGCEQLWTLDDNTLIMPELNEWKIELKNWLHQFNVSVNAADFRPELLQAY